MVPCASGSEWMSWVFENFEVIRRLAKDAMVFEFGLRGRVEGESRNGILYIEKIRAVWYTYITETAMVKERV